MNALFLSRLQFAWVISFHILLPAFTVGLSCYIATLDVLGWLTRKPVYRRLADFWIRIFAVSFGMGVVSGVVMPFQFGTNWSRFSDAVASIMGPLLGYEGLMAFFLEAGFLGVLLFGRKRVPEGIHVFAALMVAFGTLLSSFWILALNSWMQTPSGYKIVDGRFVPSNIFALIFNPSLPYRLTHTVSAFVITTAFVILGVAAYYLRRGRFLEEARSMINMSLFFLAFMVPFQIVVGDMQGVNTYEYQPAKIAAIEGIWKTQTHAASVLFAIPDPATASNRDEIAIPGLASLYLTHHSDGVVLGLTNWPRQDWPPVVPVFFSFRIMVGIAIVMLALVGMGLFLKVRKKLYETSWFLKLCTYSSPIGFAAVLAGWVTTEVGRQPWVVYGLMRTKDAVTPSLTTMDVVVSLLAYVLCYLFVFGVGTRLLLRLIRIGPEFHVAESHEAYGRPARPLSAVSDDEEIDND